MAEGPDLEAKRPRRRSPRRRRLFVWHEFVPELVTVVLGILIALSLDQAITSLHERNAAAESRAAVRGEIARNLGRMTSRTVIADCIERRLTLISRLLAQTSNQRVPRPLWIGRPQTWLMEEARWQAASQAGRASLFSDDEQAVYATIYAHFRGFRELEAAEQAAWAQLRTLEELPILTAQADWSLRQALQQARYDQWAARMAAMQALTKAAEIGIRPRANPLRGSRSTCLPIRIDRAEAMRRLGHRTDHSEP